MWCSFASHIQIQTIHIVINIIEHTNQVSVVTMDTYLIIIKKNCKALVKKNRPKRLINAKLERKKTQNIKKKCQQTFQSKWLADFCSYGWTLIVSHIAISRGNILILSIRNRECLFTKSWIEPKMFGPPTSHLQNVLLAFPHEGNQ